MPEVQQVRRVSGPRRQESNDRGFRRILRQIVAGVLVAGTTTTIALGVSLPAGASSGAPNAYVVNPFNNSVSVINTATNTVSTPFPSATVPNVWL